MKMKPAITLSLVKVLCNGIPTWYRTHSPVRSCLFGCSEQDRLAHYVYCPKIWNFLVSKLHLSACRDPCNFLALFPPETDPQTVYQALVAVHVMTDAIQNLLSARGVDPQSQLKDSLRRTRILLSACLHNAPARAVGASVHHTVCQQPNVAPYHPAVAALPHGNALRHAQSVISQEIVMPNSFGGLSGF